MRPERCLDCGRRIAAVIREPIERRELEGGLVAVLATVTCEPCGCTHIYRFTTEAPKEAR